MPKGKNQKFKLYRLAQIMLENTDEEHYITMPEIKEKLEEYEVTADRKSIYNDLKDLEKLGIEVEGEPVGNRYHYHVVERPFELPELKLLVDAIQSSKFITQKKTNTLIKKLEKLVSKYDAQKLQRQVYVSGRIKAMNENYNNFPKASDNPICHVRPHARNAQDVDELPDGRMFPKQCFWLNKEYILSQLDENFLEE